MFLVNKNIFVQQYTQKLEENVLTKSMRSEICDIMCILKLKKNLSLPTSVLIQPRAGLQKI